MSMGHRDIFVHVGDGVRIRAPNGQMVAPLVTGQFITSNVIFYFTVLMVVVS